MGFRFKQFEVNDDCSTMKVSTDSVLLGAWVDVSGCERILDIGTGCGIIALMVAQRSKASITAVEIDRESAGQAQDNFLKSPWNDRLIVHAMSIQDFTENCSVKFDHILSNPPYFENSLKSGLEKRTIARHDELLSIAVLMESVSQLLDENGRFSCIIPYSISLKLISYGLDNRLYVSRQLNIKTNPHKDPKLALFEFQRNEPSEIDVTELSVYEETKKYSEPYKFLTHDFYLNF